MGNFTGGISLQKIQCALFIACVVLFAWAFMLRSTGISIPKPAPP